jgi:hypothetical protein
MKCTDREIILVNCLGNLQPTEECIVYISFYITTVVRNVRSPRRYLSSYSQKRN